MATCRSCGASIKWITLKSGKHNPVDPYLRTIKLDGGKETIITEDGDILHGTFCAFDNGGERSGYVSHFATCPNANFHRNRR